MGVFAAMLTVKSATLAILALLALLYGVGANSPLAVTISIPIFAFFAYSLILSLGETELDVAMGHTLEKHIVYEDEACSVTIEITNKGSKVDYLELLDVLPPNLHVGEGSNIHVVSLGRGETFSATYLVKPKVYGYYEIGPTVVRAGDILGSKSFSRTFPATSALHVLPKIGYIGRIDIKPKRTRNWPGEIVSRRVGAGMEFYSLTDYSQGDPIRRINWKASSKQEERLFTNQFMSELGGDTIIVLDARSDSEVGVPPESTVTYSIRAAAVVAYRLLRDRNRVGLVSLGSSLDKVFPGFGKRQFDRIQVALSRVRSGSTWDIRGVGHFLSMFFSTMVQVVVVSSLNDRASIDAVFDVARRGYRVLVVSPSPIEIAESLARGKGGEKRAVVVAEEYALAVRLLKVERRTRLEELMRIATVADWNVGLPLSDALQEVTHQWKRQGTGRSR